jgi:hypothetical protein
MTRPHTMLELERAEKRLAQATAEVEALQNSQDCKLDLEFFTELTCLMQRFQFVPQQVVQMLIARETSQKNLPRGQPQNKAPFYLSDLLTLDGLSDADERRAETSDHDAIDLGLNRREQLASAN